MPFMTNGKRDYKDNNPRNNKRSNLRVSTAKTNLKREGRRKKYAS